jgi:hypothetical protein
MQSAIDIIAYELGQIISVNNNVLISKLKEIENLPIELIEDVVKNQSDVATDVCRCLGSGPKLKSYVKEHFPYVAPVEHVLGYTQKTKTRNGVHKVVQSPDTLQYVPILKTLKAMLSHDDVLGQILESHQSVDGLVRDYCDGELFQQNDLFKSGSDALQLELYHDDFTCTNPLRNRSKRQKISAFYFVVGNFSPRYRSKLDHIQLALLCSQDVVKKYGFSAIVKPLVDDLLVLEQEGISVKVDGRQLHFHGSVSFFAADNLAAHCLGGFFQNFSTALRLCRTCNATKDAMQSSFNEKHFQMRTKES